MIYKFKFANDNWIIDIKREDIGKPKFAIY